MPLLSVKFGAGLNSRVALQDVQEVEAAGGENFDIIPGDSRLNWRKPFDFVSQCPVGQPIQGYASFVDTQGGYHLIVQSGGYVFLWDGFSAWQAIGEVPANAQLRGSQASFWAPLDAVLIGDMASAAPIYGVNSAGTMWVPTFTRGVTPMSTMRARYLLVAHERLLCANIVEPGGHFPHLIVASASDNPFLVSTQNRPSSAIGAGDPWFLPTPDLRAVSGFLKAFQSVFLLTHTGSIYELAGDTVDTFGINEFYTSGHPTGTEAYVFDGDDLLYGRHGRIESLRATQNYGDVATADLSWLIGPDIADVDDWRLVYNRTTQRLYAFPLNRSEVWVTSKHLYKTQLQLSPWVRWTTAHPLLFRPTCAFSAVAPFDGVEYTFMGDGSGNMYRMEGSGTGDGGTVAITGRREGKLYRVEGDGAAQNFSGQLDYIPDVPQQITLQFVYAGEEDVTEAVTLSLPGQTNNEFYWNETEAYFGGSVYWNASLTRRKRPRRQSFGVAGQSSHLQISVETQYTTPYIVDAVEVQYDARPSRKRA